MENLKSGGSRYNPVYSVLQENLIKGEFSRLKDQCYLEHAGATLYSEKQMSDIFSDLGANIYGNPHANKLTEDLTDQIRYEILQHFNTSPEHYTLIFTSGSTGSLKMVAENFQYNENGTFVYLMDNHTSVLGMREYSETSVALPHEEAFKILSSQGYQRKQESGSANSLFVYPAQCNFSGTKYPLSWIEKVKNGILNGHNGINPSGNWFCMLDAASFVSTNYLDLSEFQPDFVCLSFYKMFGYPTGLGALLVKNSSAHVLKKKYFGGGTVFMALSSERIHVPRENLYERFEDGTLPFLSIVSLRHGFATWKRLRLRIVDISRHTFALAQYVFQRLVRLHHGNGKPAVVFYHDTDFQDVNSQGGIINFNLLRPSGEFIGYAEVLHISNLYGIHLRTGCFCNPGACQRHLGLTTNDIKNHFNAGHVCGDQNDLIDGYPTGSVRISFGYMSTKKDADTFLDMVEECFVTKPIIRQIPVGWKTLQEKAQQKFKIERKNHDKTCINNDLLVEAALMTEIRNCDINSDSNQNGILKQIFIYPVKSCAAFSIDESWELTNTGFKYDRQWMIVNANGVCVTQKNDTRLCLIKPKININKKVLEMHFEGESVMNVPLNMSASKINSVWPLKCQSKVCGDRIQGWDCGNEVGNWLSEVLGLPGLRLLRQCNDDNGISRSSKQGGQPQLSLTNQAQFLLINTASVQWLMDCIPENQFNKDLQGLINRFRPNFVVEFLQPFVENSCSQIKIGNILFKCDGQCTRCQMICIDQSTGEKSVEPLKTLSKEFNGKISFGAYLSNTTTKHSSNLKLNDSVTGLFGIIK
ncbi:hypothetical protein ILUMI_01176 [Ignelater luminosus]|uniref:Molybdenum cofactor sulfurase n=1 Tax=Ignelater luminosus TaxID=2038154 RepID=A0A8K0GKI0_IGNLU|nr:hypothetical protein ILUMI_01176 [Ignelater luminosus]